MKKQLPRPLVKLSGFTLIGAGFFVGVVGAAAGLIALLSISPLIAEEFGLVGIVFWVLIIAPILATFALIGNKLFNLGKRLATPTAKEILNSAKGAPIVFLRSFDLDGVSITRASNDPFAHRTYYRTVGETIALEEIVAESLREYGPTVAIGRPGEKIPPAGFGRMWLPDSEWRAKVDEFLAKSQLVVMMLGEAHSEKDGLGWELVNVLKKVKPARIVFVVPPSGKRYWRNFRQIARGKLNNELSDKARFVTFSDNWQSKEFIGENDDDRSYAHALKELLRTKSDFLVRQSMPRRLKRALIGGAAVGFLGGIPSLFLFVGGAYLTALQIFGGALLIGLGLGAITER